MVHPHQTLPHQTLPHQALVLLAIFNTAVQASENNATKWKLETRISVQGEFSQFSANALDFKGTYYNEPIENGSGTFAELEFLNPVSGFSLRALAEDSKGGWETFSGYHIGFESSLVRGNFVYQPGVHYTDYAGIETFGAGVDIAYLMTDVSRVFGGLQVNREQIASGNVLASTADIGYRKLWQYANGHAFAAQLNFAFTNTENETRKVSIAKYSTGFDYYFSQRWGVGLDLSHSIADVERYESVGLGVSAGYYYSPKIGVEFGVGLAQDNENTLKANGAVLLTIRF